MYFPRNQRKTFALNQSMRFLGQESIFNHRYERLVHVVGWIGYLIAVGLLWFFGAVYESPETITEFLLTVLVYLPGIFYLITFYLIPRFLQRKQWAAFFKRMFMLLLAMLMIEAVVDLIFATSFDFSASQVFTSIGSRLLLGFISMLMLTVFAFVYRFTVDGIENAYRVEQLKAEKTAIELALLKSQIDPHFLFNTLNSLYALALSEKSETTADGIAKLGILMRYNLHDAQEEQISLAKEVHYIKEYVALQRLRTTEENDIALQIDIGEEQLDELRIAPMLLIPFVENAFKFSINAAEPAWIRISMHHEGATFFLNVENSLPQQRVAFEPSGIGLKNVQERLSKIYPDKHNLQIQQAEGAFKVRLEVSLA